MRQYRPARFMRQHDQFDCGVACLQNILAFYKVDISIEKLREWSGAGWEGTSLLGLHQAATLAGFKAEGIKASGMEALSNIQHPCILHVTLEGGLMHYVIYYPAPSAGSAIQPSDRLLIGDPAKGLFYIEAAALERIWTSHHLLLLDPGEKLAQYQKQRQKKIKWLWQTLRKDANLLIVALGLGTGCACLNLTTAVFSQRLLDNILPGHQPSQLILGLVLLGLLLIMKGLFSFLRQHFLIRQGFAFNLRMTGGFFRSILYLNKSFFDHRQTGDLIARLNDTQRIQQTTSYALGEMTVQCLSLLTTLGLLFWYAPPIAWFCLVIIPLVVALMKYFEADIIREQKAVMTSQARNECNYVDSIRGIHTIKAMNKEPFFSENAAQIFLSFQNSVMQLGKIRIRFSLILEIVTALFLLTVIGWAAFDTWQGNLRTGQMIAILQLAGMLMQTIILIALTSMHVQEAAVALDRMVEFTRADPEYQPQEEPVFPTSLPIAFRDLVIDNMGFRFPGRKLLLKDVSLRIKKGDIIALSGESGQGKSTILQVLQKFYPYEGGQVTVNGSELAVIETLMWRKTYGIVPQDIAVFSATVLANICLDPDTGHVENVRRFCHDYGFDRYFECLPQSYATLLGEGGLALSGGQKQLLALARCLYAKPQLVFLDEPTAAMDATTEQFVITVLRRYRQHAGMLIVSHKDSLTSIADKIYLLDKGNTYEIPHIAAFAGTN